jgi:glycine cleavage system aminomethyltransferase T
MPNQLLLRDLHRERGASTAEIDGWEVPLHYGDPAA